MQNRLHAFILLATIVNIGLPSAALAKVDLNYIQQNLPDDEKRFQDRFQTAILDKSYTCILRYKRRPNGSFCDLKVITPSGNARVDSQARSALEAGIPYFRFDANEDEFFLCQANCTAGPRGTSVSLSLPGIAGGSSKADRVIAAKRLGQLRDIKLMQDRIATATKTLGANNPKMWESYNFTANLYREVGQQQQALDMYQKAMATQAKTPDSSQAARTMSDRAEYYLALGETDKALADFEAVSKMQALADAKDANYLLNLERLAKYHFKAGRTAEADALYAKIKEIKDGQKQ